MRTYLVETDNSMQYVRSGLEHVAPVKPPLRLRVLLSYHYYRGIDLFDLFGKYFEKPWPDLFLDSGAFSAKTQGVEIDLGAYAEWVKHHQSIASAYANLDVIGDFAATARNQRELERRGLRPLPVFHTREPWSALEALVEQYPYIALGGIVGERGKREAVKAWIGKCFAIAAGRSVFHGFGVTAWPLMKGFRWYSVDSSSWRSGFQFGRVSLFDEDLGKFVKVELRDKSGAWQHRKLIERYGFSPSDLAIEGRYDQAKICAMSAEAFMRAEAYVRRLHGDVSIPGRAHDGAGLKGYLADRDTHHLSWAQGALGRSEEGVKTVGN